MTIKINELDRLKLLEDVASVHEQISVLKRDLKNMRYEVLFEDGTKAIIDKNDPSLTVVTDPEIIKRFYKNARIQ